MGFFIIGFILASLLATSQLTLPSSPSITDIVNKLEVPRDINVALLRYGGEHYSKNLEAAWNHALEAKQSSYDFGWYFSIDPSSLELGIFYEESLEEFNLAIKEAMNTFDGMNKMLAEDVRELDHVGADQNSSNVAHKKFLDVEKTFHAIEAKVKETVITYGDPCKYQDIVSKAKCVVDLTLSIRSESDVLKSVDLFNSIIGDEGVLYDYYFLHEEILEAVSSMHDEYKNKIMYFHDTINEIKDHINFFGNERIKLLNQDIMNKIEQEEESPVKMESLALQISDISKKIKHAEIEKSRAEETYESKEEDYIFLAVQKVDKQNLILSDVVEQIQNMRKEINELEYVSKKIYEEFLDKNKNSITNSFYIEAVKLGFQASSENKKGEKIEKYAKAIEYLRLVSEGKSKVDFEYVDKVLSSLEKVGVDINYEKELIENLKQINDPFLLDESNIHLNRILEKLNEKGKDFKDKVLDLRSKALAYLEVSYEFINNPALGYEINSDKIKELELKYEKSLSKNLMSDLHELYVTYNNIISYIKPKIEALSSKYLQDSSIIRYFFLEIPSCNKAIKTDIMILVKNPLSVTLEDISIFKEISIPMKETQDLNILDNKIFFSVNKLDPNKIYQRKLSGKTTPLRCSDSTFSSEKDVYILNKEIDPLTPLDQILVLIEIPQNSEIISVFPGKLVSNNEILIENIFKKTVLQVQYIDSQSNQTYNNESQLIQNYINDSKIREDMLEQLNKINNQIQDICYFIECSDLKKIYDDLKIQYDNDKNLDFLEIEQKINEKANNVLVSLTNNNFTKTNNLKKQFYKALNNDVDIEVSNRFILYNEEDLEKIEDESEKLRQIDSYFNSISLSSETSIERFEELINKVSKNELKSFKEDLKEFEEKLNSNILSLESEAKSKLIRARNEFEQTSNEEIHDVLSKSVDHFDNKYYTKSIILSDYIHDKYNSIPKYSFPYEYLILAGIFVGFTIYIFKKPKNLKKKKTKIRRFDDL